jgi:hypothetical protein
MQAQRTQLMFSGRKFFSRPRRGFLFGMGMGQDKNDTAGKIFCGGVYRQPPKMWYAFNCRAQGLVLLGSKALLSDRLLQSSTDSRALEAIKKEKQ